MWLKLIHIFVIFTLFINVFCVGVESGYPDESARNVDNLKIPKRRLIKALREVFQVPEDVIAKKGSKRGPSPPQYMLDLYKKMKEGRESLPQRANTVRCIMPVEEQWRESYYMNMIFFNISQANNDQVLLSSLHLPSPTQRRQRNIPNKLHPKPPRATRVMVYMLKPDAPRTSDTPPLVIALLPRNAQDVDMTKVVKEAIQQEDIPYLAIKVEELRRGKKWTPIPPHRLVKRTPPLLLIYSLDPYIMNMKSINYTALTDDAFFPYESEMIPENPHHRAQRDINSEPSKGNTRNKRSLLDQEINNMENGLENMNNEIVYFNEINAQHNHGHKVHKKHMGTPKLLEDSLAYSILTNELPKFKENEVIQESHHVHHKKNSTTSTEKINDVIKIKPEKEQSKKSESINLLSSKRRKKSRSKKKSRKNSDLIPYPKDMELRSGSRDKTKFRKNRGNKNKKNKRKKNHKISDLLKGFAENLLQNGKDDNFINKRSNSEKSSCEMKELRVSLKEIGWDSFVIAPQMFLTHYCDGKCSYPLMEENSTNHAVMQSLLRFLGRVPELPEPCCVPDEMDSLTLLMVDKNGNLVLKNFSNMVVRSCSCQ